MTLRERLWRLELILASEVAVAVEEWWWCCTDSVLKSWFGVRSAAAAEERGEEAWAEIGRASCRERVS